MEDDFAFYSVLAFPSIHPAVCLSQSLLLFFFFLDTIAYRVYLSGKNQSHLNFL